MKYFAFKNGSFIALPYANASFSPTSQYSIFSTYNISIFSTTQHFNHYTSNSLLQAHPHSYNYISKHPTFIRSRHIAQIYITPKSAGRSTIAPTSPYRQTPTAPPSEAPTRCAILSHPTALSISSNKTPSPRPLSTDSSPISPRQTPHPTTGRSTRESSNPPASHHRAAISPHAIRENDHETPASTLSPPNLAATPPRTATTPPSRAHGNAHTATIHTNSGKPRSNESCRAPPQSPLPTHAPSRPAAAINKTPSASPTCDLPLATVITHRLTPPTTVYVPTSIPPKHAESAHVLQTPHTIVKTFRPNLEHSVRLAFEAPYLALSGSIRAFGRPISLTLNTGFWAAIGARPIRRPSSPGLHFVYPNPGVALRSPRAVFWRPFRALAWVVIRLPRPWGCTSFTPGCILATLQGARS